MESGKQKERHMESERRRKRSAGGRAGLSRCLSILSTVFLIVLVLLCLPLTAPRFLGYQVYAVISGSMEPSIPTGSLVYIRETAPEELGEGDVIAFYGARDSASIITHRVVENRVVTGELVTKGDANETNDMNPVPYGNVIGKAVWTIPAAGAAAELLTSREGKLLAGGVIAAAILLQAAAARAGRRRTEKEKERDG